MRILLTGANGFIGGHVLAGLRARGHEVVACVRDPVGLRRRVPGIVSIACDLNRDTDRAAWQTRLAGIDAVVNCAGVLKGGRGQSIRAIHELAPRALFEACVDAGVRRVVQISAVGVDPPADTDYARSKKAGDDALRGLDLNWTTLRPSLVYAAGSYGGTSAMRGLAALPFAIPLVGGGGQAFRPVHVEDLAETVARVLASDGHARQVIEVVGPQRIDLRGVLLRLRRWLGLRDVPTVAIPVAAIAPLAAIGEHLGGPLSTTSLRQIEHGADGTWPDGRFEQVMGFAPRSMEAALAATPAQEQDRLHARLYFVGPLLRVMLALMWLGSGLVGLVASPQSWGGVAAFLESLGLGPRAVALPFCALDILVGMLVLTAWRVRWTTALQLAIVLGYSVGLSAIAPGLWLDPFGALLKNLPVIAAILAWGALEEGR